MFWLQDHFKLKYKYKYVIYTRNFGFGRLWGLDLPYNNFKINVTYQKRV